MLAWLPLLAALLVAACASAVESPAAPTPTSPGGGATPTSTAAARITPTPLGLQQALVLNVVDGDTIDVLIEGRRFRLRYIGVDTPETVDPRRPVECFGREAAERNRQLVAGRTVYLEKDVSETDAFGRLLRYVWVDGRMVNAALVEEGFATAATFPPDVRHAALLAELEARARSQVRGLWGPTCATPQAAAAGDGPCDFSGTDEPVVKGNISVRTGEKIYHVPGGEFYDATVVDESKGERWFCTEAEALEAGWRKSKR